MTQHTSSRTKNSGLNIALILGIILIAGVVTFLAAMLWLNRGAQANSAPGMQATLPTSPVTQDQPAQTSVPASSASPSITADFPPDGSTKCRVANSQNYSSFDFSDARSVNKDTTCQFISDVRGEVLDKVLTTPTLGDFALSLTSMDDQNPGLIKVSCSRHDHLTTCQTTRSTIYVKDAIGG